jgi:NADPH-dependent 2,4-dienoyl-CoA reductase/sulfur reductase-like enzyme/nitrite reductase/ring-hydroxylating ferredoxin subunit
MGNTSTDLTGPDLEVGVPEGDLIEGSKLLGHARGKAVLLVRSPDGVFAVGATCTHYGGPLVDGIIVGDTVRCPWHHACFNLRSGAAERPPARDPVECWRVERQGDRLRVTAPIEAPESSRPVESPSSVVLVGGGAAANAAAETLRREGYDGPITMVSADADVPVDRPNLSKDFLAGNAQDDWIPLRPMEFYDEHRIQLRLSTRVTAIDTAKRQVTLSDGATLDYGALLLATGAEPLRPSIPGADAPHVHTLRTLADSRAIVAQAATAKTAVVLGASFIGLEVAASLRARGVAVHVVAPDKTPLAKVLGDEVGALVRSVHEEHGVVFHLGETAASIEAGRVVLASGASLPAELVVMGVGVRPATALAEAAGLTVDRGVVVDGYLATSAPSVYAAGDVARYPDGRSGEPVRIEHWVVAQRQGQVAARNLLGARERFDAVPFFWSAHYDMTISYVGHALSWDRIDLDGSLAARDVAIAYRRGGRTLAVATIGRDTVALEAEAAMERGDEEALRRLIPEAGAARPGADSKGGAR